jgi:hypothetical protein
MFTKLNTQMMGTIILFFLLFPIFFLYHIFEKQGTDEMAFIVLLTHRSDTHLRKVFEAYPSKYRETVQEVIIKEFKGDMEKALLGLGKSRYMQHSTISCLALINFFLMFYTIFL